LHAFPHYLLSFFWDLVSCGPGPSLCVLSWLCGKISGNHDIHLQLNAYRCANLHIQTYTLPTGLHICMGTPLYIHSKHSCDLQRCLQVYTYLLPLLAVTCVSALLLHQIHPYSEVITNDLNTKIKVTNSLRDCELHLRTLQYFAATSCLNRSSQTARDGTMGACCVYNYLPLYVCPVKLTLRHNSWSWAHLRDCRSKPSILSSKESTSEYQSYHATRKKVIPILWNAFGQGSVCSCLC
jgi:hypothetical protein